MKRSTAAGLATAAILLAAGVVPAGPVLAQDYFLPPQRQAAPAPTSRPAAPRPAPRAAERPPTVTPMPAPEPQPQADLQPALPPIQLPPPPDVPALPQGVAPPVAVIGVIGVPDVMQASTAAQEVEKVVGARRDKLNEDAQKEQNTWREMQQALANDRGKLSPEQIRDREKQLQDRVTDAQRRFRDRNAAIQQAAQVGLAQIERTLISVIREVAQSRGMNMVLHRAQVALNVNEFDITQQVTAQLNKILPTVLIPSETGAMPPVAAAGPAAGPTSGPTSGPTAGATPASAPGPSVVAPQSPPAPVHK